MKTAHCWHLFYEKRGTFEFWNLRSTYLYHKNSSDRTDFPFDINLFDIKSLHVMQCQVLQRRVLKRLVVQYQVLRRLSLQQVCSLTFSLWLVCCCFWAKLYILHLMLYWGFTKMFLLNFFFLDLSCDLLWQNAEHI